jgi:hypothetical protein
LRLQVRQRACRLHPNVILVYLSLRFDEDLGRSSGTGEKANLGKPKKISNVSFDSSSKMDEKSRMDVLAIVQ